MFIRDGTPSGFRTMSTGVPSGRNGMSSCGRILRDDALVAVAPRHLVAFHDLALLGDVDAHQHVDARRQFVAGSRSSSPCHSSEVQAVRPLGEVEDLARRVLVLEAREDLDVDDLALLAVRNAQGNVAGLFGLLAEDGDDQPLFRRQFALALRRDLADQDVFRPDFGADADDAVLVQVLQRVLADIRDVARDLFRAELGVAGFHFVLLDMDRREHVVLAPAAARAGWRPR